MRVDPSARSVGRGSRGCRCLGTDRGEELRRWPGRGGAGEGRGACAVGDRRIVAGWAIYAVDGTISLGLGPIARGECG